MQSRYSFSGFSRRNACGFALAEDDDAVVVIARRNALFASILVVRAVVE
jgi:hypothetical protein|tara:strand:+ start:1377 stop:1523 length:147 start_codon:yes stop_codon:yes gene_type:complete